MPKPNTADFTGPSIDIGAAFTQQFQSLKHENAAAPRLVPEVTQDPAGWVEETYRHALARKPTDAEKQAALETLGQPVKPEGVADLLWALAMLPEFQLVN